MSKDKSNNLVIEVEGVDQDEALSKAEDIAKEKGYARCSLQNAVKITYSVLLLDPIKSKDKE